MSPNDAVDFPLASIEIVGLRDLLEQLTSVLRDAGGDDPALARLSPTAYPDDPEAAREFRRLTSSDLTARRLADAAIVARDLAAVDIEGEGDMRGEIPFVIHPDDVGAWMRTLTAIRLIIATRLDIRSDEPEADVVNSPAYGIYEWLAYRLERLIEATDD